ncbi:hypothetical protein DL768_008025 [Monosporascus sp. mg162]|nr:hypothetical protein DL768_008025 [Monosporascus sp. mg162]
MYQSQLPSDEESGDYHDLFGPSSDGDPGITNNNSSLNSQKGGLTPPPRSTPATAGPSSGFGGFGGPGPNSAFFIDPNRRPFLVPSNTSGLTSSSPGTPTPSSLHGNSTSANGPNVGPNERFDTGGDGNPGRTTARPYHGASRDIPFIHRGGKFVGVDTADNGTGQPSNHYNGVTADGRNQNIAKQQATSTRGQAHSANVPGLGSWPESKEYYANMLEKLVGQMNKERDRAGNQSITPAAGETGQTNPQVQEYGVFGGTEELKASPRKGTVAAPGGDPEDDGGSDDEDDKGGKKDNNVEGNNGGNKDEGYSKGDRGDKPTESRNRGNNSSRNGGSNQENNASSINNTGDNNNTGRKTSTGNTSSGNTGSGNANSGNKNIGGSDDGPRTPPPRKFEPPYPGWRPDPRLLYEDYQIRMGEGWTMSDQTYAQQPLKKRRKIDVPYPQFINHTFRSMNALSTLQIAHDAPISLSALDVTCEHLWKALHSDVRAQICVPPPNGPSLWSGDQVDINRMYEKMELPEYRNKESNEYLFYTQMKSRPWVIWPLWVEDDFGKDYVTVLLYSQPSDQSKKPAMFDQLVQYTIIDSRRASQATKRPNAPADEPAKYGFPKARTGRLDAALKNFLSHAGYDLSHVPERKTPVNAPPGPAPAAQAPTDTSGNVAGGMEDTLMGEASDSGDDDASTAGNDAGINSNSTAVTSSMTATHCSPMPPGECTSAERCFATVKEILERIVQWHLRNPDDKTRHREVFRHMRPWINPYQFRIEMAGIGAWVIMATLDYKARIAVEVIEDFDFDTVADGIRKKTKLYDLAGPFEQPPMAPADWLLSEIPASETSAS